MKYHKALLFSIVALMLTVSACVPTQPATSMTKEPTQAMANTTEEMTMHEPTTTDVMMEKSNQAMMGTPTQDMAMHETPAPDAMMEESSQSTMGTPTEDMMMHTTPSTDAMMEAPAWFDASLTNVNDGSSFSINDFAGKVVLVETMAVWCPTCKRQQDQIKTLNSAMGMDPDLIAISLDIDPNENADMLKTYAANNGFDWIYAVASVGVAREIGNLYGDQFLNPPSTPIMILDRKGEAHPLPFGVKSADDLMKAIEPYLSGM
jgi:thiol-disulfide isomerase/thioredoxin